MRVDGDAVDWTETDAGETAFRRKRLAAAADVEGTVRLDDGAEPLTPGDYVALPTGEGGGH